MIGWRTAAIAAIVLGAALLLGQWFWPELPLFSIAHRTVLIALAQGLLAFGVAMLGFLLSRLAPVETTQGAAAAVAGSLAAASVSVVLALAEPPPRPRNVVVLATPRQLSQGETAKAFVFVYRDTVPSDARKQARSHLNDDSEHQFDYSVEHANQLEPVLSVQLSGLGLKVNPETKQDWEPRRRGWPARFEWQVSPDPEDRSAVVPRERALRADLKGRKSIEAEGEHTLVAVSGTVARVSPDPLSVAEKGWEWLERIGPYFYWVLGVVLWPIGCWILRMLTGWSCPNWFERRAPLNQSP